MLKETESKWFFIEFSIPEDIEINDVEMEDLLQSIDCNYKYLVNEIIVFDQENKPTDDCMKKIKKSIYTLIQEKMIGMQEGEFFFDNQDEFEEESFNCYEAEEILFSFFIREDELEESEFINYLARIQDGTVTSYEGESFFIQNFDYEDRHYSSVPFFHNLRCSNLAIFKLETLAYGFAVIGYMKIKNGMKVTIKVFQYDMLHYILENMAGYDWYKNILWKDNLKWKWLMSRKVSKGYRITESHLGSNELMKSFLNTTKSSELESQNTVVLKKLLDKGFLNSKEYLELSLDKSINRFFSSYQRLDKNSFSSNRIWIDSSLGIIFDEKGKEAHKRIEKNNKSEKIYAPTNHLLHYIRGFWHQDYVEELVKEVQKNLNREQEDSIQIEIYPDFQFDLKRDGNPTKASRDIDVLLLAKNTKTNIDYIIAIEAKKYASEFKTVKKDINEKITQRYADIFDAFIAVTYFEGGMVKKFEEVSWGFRENQYTKKPLYLCAGTNFKKLVKDLEGIVRKICEDANE